MRSTKQLAFDLDYMMTCDRDTRIFNLLTNDYMIKSDNYAVLYRLKRFLNNLKMCEFSDITDDCFYPYSSIIFFTCMPKDALKIKYIAKRIPSSINADIKVYRYDNDTGEDIEI